MRVLISGGGTGGHIYPAIAIADEVKKRNKNNEILFVGAQDRMEMEKVPRAGYRIKGLWISGIQRKRSLKNLVVPIKLIHSLIKSYFILKQFKPDVVVGVGGYASAAVLRVAAFCGIKTLIQEQNGYAGITNKILGRHVNKVCVAYEQMNRFFPEEKIVFTGNPVRKDIKNLNTKYEEAKSFFDSAHYKNALLIFGGSLGANTFNRAMESAKTKIQENDDTLFIWQTGKSHYGRVKNLPVAQLENVRVMPFIERMDLAYAIADVVIARAGALSISELCLAQKVSVLVPSPNVAEDHQTKNAMALVEKNAALLIADKDAENDLIITALNLLENEKEQEDLKRNIVLLARENATELIVDEIEKLIKK